METHNLFMDSDNLVKITLQDAHDESYVNSGTVTMTLKDTSGVDVTGAVDLALAYVDASDGIWFGNIPDTITLTEGSPYTLWITSTSGDFTLKERRNYIAKYAGD